MAIIGNEFTGTALSTRPFSHILRQTVQRLGKRPRQRRLPHLLQPRNQIRMTHAIMLNRTRQKLHRPIMPNNILPSRHRGIVKRKA
jgi:hypothetical protein